MTTSTIFNKLNAFMNSVIVMDEDSRNRMREILSDLEADLQAEQLVSMAKQNGNMTEANEYKKIIAAAQKFSKYCAKENAMTRPSMAGANIYEHGSKDDVRQSILDGYVGVSYSKPLDVLKCEGDNYGIIPAIKFYEIIKLKANDSRYNVTLPALQELKNAFKLECAKVGKKNANRYIRIEDGTVFDIEYLIRGMELSGMFCGGEDEIEVYFGNHNHASPLHIERTIMGNKIHVVVLPVRWSGELGSPLLDYMESEL